MLCGNTAYRVKLIGDDLSRYLNKIESVALRKCLYYHYLKGVFHCAENQQSPSWFFFRKWVELMNIYVTRVLCMT